jgi:hypothetical protein
MKSMNAPDQKSGALYLVFGARRGNRSAEALIRITGVSPMLAAL